MGKQPRKVIDLGSNMSVMKEYTPPESQEGELVDRFRASPLDLRTRWFERNGLRVLRTYVRAGMFTHGADLMPFAREAAVTLQGSSYHNKFPAKLRGIDDSFGVRGRSPSALPVFMQAAGTITPQSIAQAGIEKLNEALLVSYGLTEQAERGGSPYVSYREKLGIVTGQAALLFAAVPYAPLLNQLDAGDQVARAQLAFEAGLDLREHVNRAQFTLGEFPSVAQFGALYSPVSVEIQRGGGDAREALTIAQGELGLAV